MKRLFVITFFLIISLQTQAQKNRIEIGGGSYKCFDVLSQPTSGIRVMIASVKYTRNINSKFGLWTQYSRLPLYYLALMAEVRNQFAIESQGKLIAHIKFNYFDLGGQYNIFQYRKHQFSAFAGVSLAYGENKYLTKVVWSPPNPYEPNGHPFHSEFERKMESYFGALVGIKYDYSFWKNRLNIGPDFSFRYYLNDFPAQINYGLHLGFNF